MITLPILVTAIPLRIVHIDDDADLRALVGLSLRSSGAGPVMSCESGEVAQRLVPDFRPDVILVDMMMPGMDGIETVTALRSKMDLSDVSVVFATASDDEANVHRFRQAGAVAVIHKPFDALDLADRLARIHRA